MAARSRRARPLNHPGNRAASEAVPRWLFELKMYKSEASSQPLHLVLPATLKNYSGDGDAPTQIRDVLARFPYAVAVPV